MSDFDNSGALFRNDKKESDKHPDHTGNAKISGVDYWVSAWVKEKNGRRYFSLAFKPKEVPRQQASAPAYANNDLYDDDVPF